MRRELPTLAAIVALTLATTTWAAAPVPAPPTKSTITNPDWLAKPSGADIGRFYTWLAQNLGIGGFTRMRCDVNALGTLQNCDVITLRPAGLGFRQAALAMAAYFHMRPRTLDGAPVDGGQVIVPIYFATNRPEAAAAPSADPIDPRRLAAARSILAQAFAVSNPAERWLIAIAAWRASNPTDPLDAPPAKAITPEEAFAKGIDAATSKAIDRQAEHLARELSLDDLRSIARFMTSPAGKAWLDYQARAVQRPEEGRSWMADAGAEARRLYCADVDCGDRPATR